MIYDDWLADYSPTYLALLRILFEVCQRIVMLGQTLIVSSLLIGALAAPANLTKRASGKASPLDFIEAHADRCRQVSAGHSKNDPPNLSNSCSPPGPPCHGGGTGTRTTGRVYSLTINIRRISMPNSFRCSESPIFFDAVVQLMSGMILPC